MGVYFSLIRLFKPDVDQGPIRVDFSDIQEWLENYSSKSFADRKFSETLLYPERVALAELFLTFVQKRDAMAFKLAWHGEVEQVGSHDWERVRRQMDRLPPGITRNQVTKIVRKEVEIY